MAREGYTPDSTTLPLLSGVEASAEQLRELETSMRRQVQSLRELEVPWRTIGDALGVTPQAAQQRFGK